MQNSSEGIGVGLSQAGDVKEAVINIPVIRNQMGPNHLELAPGEAAEDLPLRANDLAQVQHFLLDADDSVQHFTGRICHNLALEFGNLEGELIERRLIIFDDVV